MPRAAEPLESDPGAAAPGSQARRPRPRLRQGALLGARHQGPEVARRLAQDARRLRGRPDAARDAHPEAARQHLARRDAGRPVSHLLPAREHPRPRPLRGGRGGHARDAEGEGSDPLDPQGREAARRRRADQDALDLRPRRLGERAREGRGRRRDAHAAQGAEGAAEAPRGGQAGGRDGARRGRGRGRCRDRGRGGRAG